MNFAVQFHNNGWFGSYPYPDYKIDIIKKHGANVFVDLTEKNETTRNGVKLKKYKHLLNNNDIYINYPIKDRKIPKNLNSFNNLICKILEYLDNDQYKLYIHCRGGSGRAGLVVASLLVTLNFSVEDALKITNKLHSKRKDLSKKMLKLGAPQTKSQKKFVHKYHKWCNQ